MPLFGEHRLDYNLRSLDACGVERRLLAQADLLFLQFIQDFRSGNRLQPFVLDAANQRLLFNHKSNDFASFALVFINADIIKELHRVQRLDVSPDHVHVEPIVGLGLQVEFDCVRRDPAVSVDAHIFDPVRIGSLQRLWPHAAEQESQQH